MKDRNGKTVAAGARVVVLKYGKMRTGVVTGTREVIRTGTGIQRYAADLVRVQLDHKLDQVGPYWKQRNTWQGTPSGSILVLDEVFVPQ